MGRENGYLPWLDGDEKFVNTLNEIHNRTTTLVDNLPPSDAYFQAENGKSILTIAECKSPAEKDAAHAFKLRSGSHEIAKLSIGEHIELTWQGEFSFEEFEDYVFQNLPRMIFPQYKETIPQKDVLRNRSSVAYRTQETEETTKLQLNEPRDFDTYSNLISHPESLSTIATTVTPHSQLGIRQYAFGISNEHNVHESPSTKQKMQILIPISQGVSPEFLDWMLETVSKDCAQNIDTNASAQSIACVVNGNKPA